MTGHSATVPRGCASAMNAHYAELLIVLCLLPLLQPAHADNSITSSFFGQAPAEEANTTTMVPISDEGASAEQEEQLSDVQDPEPAELIHGDNSQELQELEDQVQEKQLSDVQEPEPAELIHGDNSQELQELVDQVQELVLERAQFNETANQQKVGDNSQELQELEDQVQELQLERAQFNETANQQKGETLASELVQDEDNTHATEALADALEEVTEELKDVEKENKEINAKLAEMIKTVILSHKLLPDFAHTSEDEIFMEIMTVSITSVVVLSSVAICMAFYTYCCTRRGHSVKGVPLPIVSNEWSKYPSALSTRTRKHLGNAV